MREFCDDRPMRNRIFRLAALMDRMMQRLGVDPQAAARADRGMAFYAARTRCLACSRERQCRDWVARAAHAPSAPPAFCDNAEFFRRLQSPLRDPGTVPETSPHPASPAALGRCPDAGSGHHRPAASLRGRRWRGPVP
jgi:hypothetical protein